MPHLLLGSLGLLFQILNYFAINVVKKATLQEIAMLTQAWGHSRATTVEVKDILHEIAKNQHKKPAQCTPIRVQA